MHGIYGRRRAVAVGRRVSPLKGTRVGILGLWVIKRKDNFEAKVEGIVKTYQTLLGMNFHHRADFEPTSSHSRCTLGLVDARFYDLG